MLQVLLKCTIPFHTIQFIHTPIAIRLLAFCAQCTPSSSFQITFPDTRSQIHFLIGFYSLADIQLAILGADYVISDSKWMSGNFDSLRSSPTAGTRDCHLLKIATGAVPVHSTPLCLDSQDPYTAVLSRIFHILHSHAMQQLTQYANTHHICIIRSLSPHAIIACTRTVYVLHSKN